MPPKRITRSQAHASQPPASQASATAGSGHARHSRRTDVEPTRHFKGWEYVSDDEATPQPEVQALSASARAREARAAIRDGHRSTAASRQHERDVERMIRESMTEPEATQTRVEEEPERNPIVLGDSSPEDTDDDEFHTPGVSGEMHMPALDDDQLNDLEEVDVQLQNPVITVEASTGPGSVATATRRKSRAPNKSRQNHGVYVLRDGDEEPQWLKEKTWYSTASHTQDETNTLLDRAVAVSIEKDSNFKKSSVGNAGLPDLQAIVRSCSQTGCQYSAENLQRYDLSQLAEFMSGRPSREDHDSLIRTSITKGTARCTDHSDGERYPYPPARIAGWAKCGHFEPQSRGTKKHGLEMPIWFITQEDGTEKPSRMWHIANDNSKTLTVTCSNRDAASCVHSIRQKIVRVKKREDEDALAAATSQASAKSLMPPPSLPRVQPGHHGASMAQIEGSKYGPSNWRTSHMNFFNGSSREEIDLMLDEFHEWSCWTCKKAVGNQPTPNSSRSEKHKWMFTDEYQKAMDDRVEYGAFVCDDEECKSGRRDFMHEQGHQTIKCPSTQGCSTTFNMVNNDTRNEDFIVNQTNTNPQQIYRLCSQPCTAMTSLRVADSNYRTSGQQFKDARALIERSQSRGRKRNRDGYGEYVPYSRGSSASGMSATTVGTMGMSALNVAATASSLISGSEEGGRRSQIARTESPDSGWR
ncbi:hypothetical protein V866_001529 [Kwoniella sp. B9012]